MVVSQNKGTPIQTPKCYSPYFGDPKKVPRNFRTPPYKYSGRGGGGLDFKPWGRAEELQDLVLQNPKS